MEFLKINERILRNSTPDVLYGKARDQEFEFIVITSIWIKKGNILRKTIQFNSKKEIERVRNKP